VVDGLGLAWNFGFFAIVTIFGTIRLQLYMIKTEGLSIAQCKQLYAPSKYKVIEDENQNDALVEDLQGDRSTLYTN